MLLGTLFTLPNATTTMAGIGEYSSPLFSDLFPIVILTVGIFLGLFIAGWIISVVAMKVGIRNKYDMDA